MCNQTTITKQTEHNQYVYYYSKRLCEHICIYLNKISTYNIIKLILLLLNIKLLQYTKNQINFLNKNYHLQNRKVFLMIPSL